METGKNGEQQLLSDLLQSSTRKQAFQTLVKIYAPKIYYFLRRLELNHDDADEQLQDVFIRFWRGLPFLKETGLLTIILYRIAIEKRLKLLRGMEYYILLQRHIFVLKQCEEFDFQEIAQITDTSVNEVRRIFKTNINN